MHNSWRTFIALAVLASLATTFDSALHAQVIPSRRLAEKKNDAKAEKEKPPEPPPLPNDERLLKFHMEFVKSVGKLAMEYEKAQDWDKAKAAYGEIVKLVPQYAPAKARLEEILAREASAQKYSFEVFANKAWQDTGLRVHAGKPIAMRASGQWTFKLEVKIGADGIVIPKELREYNIGCLLGVIDSGDGSDPEPFIIGAEERFIAKKSGKLLLRMWDIDPSDNDGSLTVDFLGTFDAPKEPKKP
ncbi:MAG TPA: hypothetical protein VL096_18895 [Pirellulaceae bacterium]|nr:hypothetical protein [Pirellulaceae bacterium]